MNEKLFKYLKKPEIYAESTSKFWDDEHISKGMLEAHLNPDLEAASRKHDFIEKSVDWISTVAPGTGYRRLLDLGCGPGMYTERLYKKGYSITGVDFSRRSIDYARKTAEEKGYSIEYLYKDYLQIEYENAFDVILLIYCDFAVLSDKQRKILLNKIHCALKAGGKFIFDVFTPKRYQGVGESSKWQLNCGSGFWKPDTYLCLEAHYIYEQDTRLNQYVIIDSENNVDVFRVWDHYYTSSSIASELKEAGFTKFSIFSDVSGKPYDEDSETMCIVAEK